MTYVDIPNSLIGAIGMLNGACKEAGAIYEITKYPLEDKYTIVLYGLGDVVVIEAEHIDDLISKVIDKLNEII